MSFRERAIRLGQCTGFVCYFTGFSVRFRLKCSSDVPKCSSTYFELFWGGFMFANNTF